MRLHATTRGLRPLAREVGVSPMSLSNFLKGTRPYARTAAVLLAWYQSHGEPVRPQDAEPVRVSPLARITDEEIRGALGRAVGERSLRSVADEVGLTHRALQLYIRGESRPREITLRKLREWYLRAASTRPGLDEATARAALSILVERLPTDARKQAEEAIRQAILRAYAASNAEPPEWAVKWK